MGLTLFGRSGPDKALKLKPKITQKYGDPATRQKAIEQLAEMKTPDHAQSSAALGVLCAIAAATVFSTGGVIVRRIDLPAWDVSFWRSVLLVATILPLLVWQRRVVMIDVRNAGLALFASALALAGSMVAFILALGEAPVANVLIVFGATPFITALLARLFLGEPLHGHTLIAMGIAATGLALSVAGSLKAGAAAGMAVAAIVVLCMSGNYVVGVIPKVEAELATYSSL